MSEGAVTDTQAPLYKPAHLGAYCLICGAPYAQTAPGRPVDLGRSITVIVHCPDCGRSAGEWALTVRLTPADNRATSALKRLIAGHPAS